MPRGKPALFLAEVCRQQVQELWTWERCRLAPGAPRAVWTVAVSGESGALDARLQTCMGHLLRAASCPGSFGTGKVAPGREDGKGEDPELETSLVVGDGKGACEPKWGGDKRPGVNQDQVVGGLVGLVRVLSLSLRERDVNRGGRI